MKYQIIETKITPKTLKKFRIIDDRVKHKTFVKDRKYLEKDLVDFIKGKNSKPGYPERYDLTVFTYNQFEDPYLIVDGSHRLEAFKRIFQKGGPKEFNAILLPSNVLGASSMEMRANFSRRLDQLLREKKLPEWIKKYDFKVVEHLSIQSLVGIDEEMDTREIVSWSNKERIDTGDENAPALTIDEYQKSREL